ncbi:MAG TPA: sulfotransferase [Xanthomonadales bacterium]|nr:sulfotransferase [Xanthomonadales bacterium]
MKQTIGVPGFFVVGAPRCGTTALCRYLMRNPQICFSRPKETHYFAQNSEVPSASQLKTDYIDRYFSHCNASNRLAGEGSVSYLYLPGIIERIRHINPQAKFIALVRNPLTMLPSYHLRMQYLLQEDEPDFARAWGLQEARARGEHMPRRCLDGRALMYGEVARFGAQIEHLFNVAGRDHAHVIVFDDFMADASAAYRGALRFLQLDDDGQTHFEPRYESQLYRYRWLQQLFFLPVARGGKKMDTVQRRKRKYNPDGSKKKDWIKRLTDWNKVPTAPRPLTSEMRAVVSDYLRADIELLSRLLQRDLGFWLAD